MRGTPVPLDRGTPATVVVGVGASRGCPADELLALIDAALAEAGMRRADVAVVASAAIKADEPAVLAAAATLGVPTRFLPADELADVRVPTPSATVAALVGTPSVAEASALLAARALPRDGRGPGDARLVVAKRRSAHATCAVATIAPVHPRAAPPRSPDGGQRTPRTADARPVAPRTEVPQP